LKEEARDRESSVGGNLQIDHRWSGGNLNLIRAYAAELVALRPDAIHAFSTPVVAALQQEARTIPIVFQAVSDPVGSGFVDSVAHLGRNIPYARGRRAPVGQHASQRSC
jgi:putative tryptophan/tyrosine transport system substrate-binding protein